MLKIFIPATEYYDDKAEEFKVLKPAILQLEHSLISISKWESRWKKAFLGKDKRTEEETIDYIRCMTLNAEVDPSVYYRLTNENITEIIEYIEDPMTATTFTNIQSKEGSQPAKKQIVTSELIYYWMIANNIPVEFQKWHLNRLLTLIHVCNIKNAPPGSNKMNKRQAAQHYASLNAARRKAR